MVEFSVGIVIRSPERGGLWGWKSEKVLQRVAAVAVEEMDITPRFDKGWSLLSPG